MICARGTWRLPIVGLSGLAVWLCGFQTARAQQPVAATVSGKVSAVGDDWIKVTSPIAKSVINVAISPEKLQAMFPTQNPAKKLNVVLTGEAETNFLAKDHCVSFAAELVGGRTGKNPIDELTLFTPDATHALEMTSTSPGSEESGAAADRVESFLVSAKIQSLRDGQLALTVPNEKGRMQQLRVRLADNAKIKVRVSEFAFARPGDMIDVAGHTYSPAGQPVTDVVAETVTIVCAKPLVNAKRARSQALAAKASKPERKSKPVRGATEELAENDTSVDDDPATEAAATRLHSAVPGVPGKGVKDLRQPGDPPAEPIILVDDFSVDGPLEKPATRRK